MRYWPLIGVVFLSACLQRGNTDLPRAGMIHTVAFTLNEDEVSGALDLVAELERELRPIPGVISLHAGVRGTQFARPTNQQGFHVLLIVLFRDVSAHQDYEVHPSHRRLVEAWASRLKEIEILDAVR